MKCLFTYNLGVQWSDCSLTAYVQNEVNAWLFTYCLCAEWSECLIVHLLPMCRMKWMPDCSLTAYVQNEVNAWLFTYCLCAEWSECSLTAYVQNEVNAWLFTYCLCAEWSECSLTAYVQDKSFARVLSYLFSELHIHASFCKTCVHTYSSPVHVHQTSWVVFLDAPNLQPKHTHRIKHTRTHTHTHNKCIIDRGALCFWQWGFQNLFKARVQGAQGPGGVQGQPW
jgi:hypothetical protein